jgi:uncharacterized protein with gpF-like domain
MWRWLGQLQTYLRRRPRKGEIRDSGTHVAYEPAPSSVAAYRAVITENVSLITGISSAKLDQVQDAVWRSITTGGDLNVLTAELHNKHGLSLHEAAEIARYQVCMSKAVMENTQQLELGITEATWQYSGVKCEGMPSHAAFHGKRFQLVTGAYLDGKWVWPGSEPGCMCASSAIIPRFDDEAKGI